MEDLSKLSDQELALELKRRNEQKNENRETFKELVAEIVPNIVEDLARVSIALSDVKAEIFNSFKEIIALKNDVYNVKTGQQSHTFSTEKHSITIGYRVNDGWDDSAQVGVAKVNKFISSLAVDANSSVLVEAITTLLKPDKNGNLKASRVLELKKLLQKHPNEDLVDGVDIIMAAHRPVRSNWFIEASAENANGQMKNIPLSISTVDFPNGFDFNFLKENA